MIARSPSESTVSLSAFCHAPLAWRNAVTVIAVHLPERRLAERHAPDAGGRRDLRQRVARLDLEIVDRGAADEVRDAAPHVLLGVDDVVDAELLEDASRAAR